MAIPSLQASHTIDIEKWLTEGFFARHETFCPRYGWLKKGFDGVLTDPGIFDAPDAIELLGVGKNMVRAIRFWCMAFHIIEPENVSEQWRLGGSMRVTPLGQALLSEDGWDAFLEDPASLWLLHWQLFMPPISATSWSLAINVGLVAPFNLKDFSQVLIERKDRFPSLSRYSDSSVSKDASCFVRMYAPSGRENSEEIECPFTHLGLLSSDEGHTYRFNINEKLDLPDLIFLAACLDYAQNTQPHIRTLSLNRIAYDFNSPGSVFKLSETDIGHRLERVSHGMDGVSFTESHGTRQLQFEIEPGTLSWQALAKYFETSVPLKVVR
jgi:hypothetical protein